MEQMEYSINVVKQKQSSVKERKEKGCTHMKIRWKRALSGLLAIALLFPFPIDVQAKTNLDDFTYSYRPLVEKILEKHPNWTIEPVYTHIQWKDLIAFQTSIGRNLIENTVGDAWKSKEKNVTYNGKVIDLFDETTGKYYILSAPNWVQPSEETVAYYLDPRNFLNEQDIFMFENMVYVEECHTENAVNAVLGKSWMNGSFLEDDNTMTYAQALVKIGCELNISPFMLATRLVQEQGVKGTSPLISGTYPGYEGYYNYFNINASGETQTEIYESGFREAVTSGWNTRYKALLGGATKIFQEYVSRGQTTLYYQKFNVVNGLSWKQYMQNIRAPYNEGRRVRNTYESLGLIDNEFVFKIPVYDGMPDIPCKIPSEGNSSTPTVAPTSPVTPTATPKPTATPIPSGTPSPTNTAPSPSIQPTEPSVMYGDVNGNQQVDAADALLVLQHVVGLKNLSIPQMVCGDVDGSGYLESMDALEILQFAVHLIDRFPVQNL